VSRRELRAWRVRVQRFEPAGQIARIKVRAVNRGEAWERAVRQGIILDPWALDRRGEPVRQRRRRKHASAPLAVALAVLTGTSLHVPDVRAGGPLRPREVA